jgi:copper chaperone NosL
VNTACGIGAEPRYASFGVRITMIEKLHVKLDGMTGLQIGNAAVVARREFLEYLAGLVAGIGFWGLPLSGLAAESGRFPNPGAKPLDEDGRMRISPQDRCPVCAMKVDAHPRFSSAIQLADGTTFYFCGTGCMIRAWLHPEAYLQRSKAQLRRSVVQEYFGGRHLDGLSVIWVAGSDVVGPMGPALVPLKDEADLEVFRKRHGGTAVFHLGDLDDQKWQEITGKKALP